MDQPMLDRKHLAPLDQERGLMQPELPLPSPFQASAKLHTCLSLSANPKPSTHSDLLLKELLWRSGGREAEAYSRQRKTETELKLWRGEGVGGGLEG